MKKQSICLCKGLVLIVAGIIYAASVQAQDHTVGSIEKQYEHLASRWLEISDEIKVYQGLGKFCNDPGYQQNSINILESLHHYNAVVFDILNDPETDKYQDQKVFKNTIRDIEKFEETHETEKFIDFMDDNCTYLNELETNKANLLKQSQMYSFDGRIFILETLLYRFMRRIDKKVVSIDNNIHLIHPEHQIVPLKMLAKND
ncbi:hypothetical protein [Reichenbachiella sp. MALMAid0571]|uniref:hypothetical protein n=1 Tax=Reichenbachiella sp. MALMAid0571 TaxID=3143939 RepID=UPI0032DF22F7